MTRKAQGSLFPRALAACLLLGSSAVVACNDPTGVYQRPMDARLLVSTSDGNRTAVGVMNADGSGFEEILVEYAAPMLVSWAPDYQRFAMAREVRYGFSIGFTIWSIGIDGSDRRTVLESDWGMMDRISWSPDGRRILFGACQFLAIPVRCGIFTIPKLGGEIDTLVLSTRQPMYPQWSPDGRAIAFVQDSGDGTGLYIMSADGTGIRELLTTPYELGSPAWSPDGQRMAFVSDQAGPFEIWTVRADGSGARRLTDATGYRDTDPQWSPDGKSIAFIRTFFTDPPRVMFVSDTGGEPRQIEGPTYVSSLAW